MNKSRLLGAVCACLVTIVFTASAYADLVTIDFDTPQANYTPQFRTIRGISSEFQSLGISFSNATIADQSGPGCTESTPGGCHDDLMLFGGGGTYQPDQDVTLTFPDGTDYFSIIGWYSGRSNYIKAYGSDGSFLGQVDNLTTDPAFTRMTFSGIGDIYTVVVGTRSSAVAWDDIIFNSAVVPLPPALWLFGSGLLGLVGLARRKNVTCMTSE
jgi:hypothetical protein